MSCGKKSPTLFSSPRPRKTAGVTLDDEVFEMIKDELTGKSISVTKYTWQNENQIKISMINYGASIIAAEVPDKKGNISDVVLGFRNFEEYVKKSTYYMGATIGRVANRIANSGMTIRDHTFRLNANIPPHLLNGGSNGFHTSHWASYVDNKRVVMSLHSPDNDEGFPGDVVVNAFFELTDDNEFLIEYRASTTKPTWVNLTSHVYFNLAGHDQGAEELYNHSFSINSEYVSEVNRLFIPTGYKIEICKTPFDFRTPNMLREVLNKAPALKGFDHNYCLTKGEYQQDTFAARVLHPSSGRVLEVYSNQPTVQFTTGNNLPISPDTHFGDPKKLDTLVSKSNGNYYRHGGFCLSPQYYPDAVNHQDIFPNVILNPGDIYYSTIRYKFLVQK